ncbi:MULTISPECIES: hypothetical protein [Nocardia]|uniref:hypothetical protein n=1 Tax=Nocardia abscessus TaxID=120957 RepID=UPI0018945D5F|nr:hypothetical protein [Nocardia abscessus]MBF6473718.1 hypothetical protein [Nocardia abscessus]
MSNSTGDRYDDNVTDLQARRRCHLERSGLDSAAIAAHLLVETGSVPLWDNGDDYDGGDWAA